ncbi:hypothetical protein K435DRAFT_781446 [Dendrothele bispora CBS 962.96]|uniref:Uncharacterized protein n=1 Tax=Dendrothele bispora (strain CBS 962.96) TaxID=1314807 RepID=A0A4S8LM51_DENBC|nr:hypothetical protein K435DRAFT_781446 [Dendrothele bispora CBS 962.96]
MQSMSIQPQNWSNDNPMGQMEEGSDTGGLAVDGQDGNRDIDIEQRVAGRTGGKEDDVDIGLAGAGALSKGDSGDEGAQTAVTWMLPVTSSRGDEGLKGDKNDGNQTTNAQSHGAPDDTSRDETTQVGSSRGRTASGTDIAGSSQRVESQVTKASNTGNNEREERSSVETISLFVQSV